MPAVSPLPSWVVSTSTAAEGWLVAHVDKDGPDSQNAEHLSKPGIFTRDADESRINE